MIPEQGGHDLLGIAQAGQPATLQSVHDKGQFIGTRTVGVERLGIECRLGVVDGLARSDPRVALEHSEAQDEVVLHFNRSARSNGIRSRGNPWVGERMQIVKLDRVRSFGAVDRCAGDECQVVEIRSDAGWPERQ